MSKRGAMLAVLPLALVACNDGDGASGDCVKVTSRYQLHVSVTNLFGELIETEQVHCSFDREALTHSCEFFTKQGDGTLSGPSQRVTTTWTTWDDLLRTGRLIGLETSSRTKTEDLPDHICVSTVERTYGEDGRLLSSVAADVQGHCPVASTVWRDWEPGGRPTRGTLTGGTCIQQQVVRAYDDASGVVTVTQSQDEGCGDAVTTTTYDAKGRVQTSKVVNGVGTRISSYTSRETTTVCR